MANALFYQYSFKLARKDGVPDVALLNRLTFDMASLFTGYLRRKELHFSTSVFDHGEDGFPVINVAINMEKATVDFFEFLLEVVSVPSKLVPDQRIHLESILTEMLPNEEFKLWWSSDPRGPRKRPLEDKQKVLNQLKEAPNYNGSNDLQLEDIEISIGEALEFFGFSKTIKSKELKKTFKKKFREFQLKYHPDSDSGDEKVFMHVQNCRDVVEKWMKRN